MQLALTSCTYVGENVAMHLGFLDREGNKGNTAVLEEALYVKFCPAKGDVVINEIAKVCY